MNPPHKELSAEEKIRTEMRVEVRGYLVLATLVSLVIGGLIGYFTPQRSEQQSNAPLEAPAGWGEACVEPSPEGTLTPTATPKPVRVYLSGAVQEPQVVELPADSLLSDAVAAVGGLLSNADMQELNLAAPLADHQHIIIPTLAPNANVQESDTEQTAATTARLNINTATVEELITLPNIGQSRAADIIAYREAQGGFQQIEELQEINGIGENIFAELAPLVTVEE